MQPLNIAVVSLKGGIGKSNTSLLLFEAFRHVGKVVRLNDWDGQGTSTKALRNFYPEYESEKAASPEIVIWDTPPSLEHTATAAAVRSADIVLVLTTPAPSDGWTVGETMDFIRGKMKAGAVVRAILSRYVDLSQPLAGAEFLRVMIQERECYKQMPVTGWDGLEATAKQEVLEFAVSVASLPRPSLQ
jgi:chromosome partitioning protein